MNITKIDKAKIFFTYNGQALCEYIDFMDEMFAEENQIFEGHDLGGEFTQERDGLEYSPKLSYPSWEELDQDEIIQLLNWCYDHPKEFGNFSSKEEIIEEQIQTYNNEMKLTATKAAVGNFINNLTA